MSENVLGFMHHAMKKMINVQGKAPYPKKLETAGIYRKFIQPIATKCFYIFYWFVALPRECMVPSYNYFWGESRKYFLVFASTDSQEL
jgi:hypothetical protein